MMGILGLPPGTEIYCHAIPIVLIISGVWSATRHDSWNDIFRHTWRFGWTAFVFMGAIMGLIILTPLLPWFVVSHTTGSLHPLESGGLDKTCYTHCHG